jgi:hypothetical protein
MMIRLASSGATPAPHDNKTMVKVESRLMAMTRRHLHRWFAGFWEIFSPITR